MTAALYVHKKNVTTYRYSTVLILFHLILIRRIWLNVWHYGILRLFTDGSVRMDNWPKWYMDGQMRFSRHTHNFRLIKLLLGDCFFWTVTIAETQTESLNEKQQILLFKHTQRKPSLEVSLRSNGSEPWTEKVLNGGYVNTDRMLQILYHWNTGINGFRALRNELS